MEGAKKNVQVSQTYGAKRCHVLEPVLEHYEAPSEIGFNSCPSNTSEGAQNNKKRKAGMRILAKLRDGYVKIMNDMASGADMSGVSSFYGCPGTDYSVFTVAHARLQREEQEKEIMLHALQVQLVHSRQFTARRRPDSGRWMNLSSSISAGIVERIFSCRHC